MRLKDYVKADDVCREIIELADNFSNITRLLVGPLWTVTSTAQVVFYLEICDRRSTSWWWASQVSITSHAKPEAWAAKGM